MIQLPYIAAQKSHVPPGFVSFMVFKFDCVLSLFLKQNFAGTPPLKARKLFSEIQTSRELYLCSYTKIHGCLFLNDLYLVKNQ